MQTQEEKEASSAVVVDRFREFIPIAVTQPDKVTTDTQRQSVSAGPGAAGEGPHEDGVGDARPGDEGHRGRRPTLIRLCQAPGQQGQEKVRKKLYYLSGNFLQTLKAFCII